MATSHSIYKLGLRNMHCLVVSMMYIFLHTTIIKKYTLNDLIRFKKLKQGSFIP